MTGNLEVVTAQQVPDTQLVRITVLHFDPVQAWAAADLVAAVNLQLALLQIELNSNQQVRNGDEPRVH